MLLIAVWPDRDWSEGALYARLMECPRCDGARTCDECGSTGLVSESASLGGRFRRVRRMVALLGRWFERLAQRVGDTMAGVIVLAVAAFAWFIIGWALGGW